MTTTDHDTPIGVTTNLHLLITGATTPPKIAFRFDANTDTGYLTIVTDQPFHQHRVCVSGTPAELEGVLLTALAHLRAQAPVDPPILFDRNDEAAHLELGARAATGNPLPDPVGVGA